MTLNGLQPATAFLFRTRNPGRQLADLEPVARARPKSAAALGEIPEVRGWQVEVLGADFLKALGN